MGAAHGVGRFVADWRNGATLLATLLIALVIYVVLDSSVSRREARILATESAKAAQAEVQSSRESRAATTARIDSLQERIGQLINEVEEASEEKGRALAQAEALARQVEQLGGRPVVEVSTK